jgi:hypothetical protein
MTNIERMKFVDKLMDDISEQIGVLVKHGVFTLEEGVAFIKTISDKQLEWLRTNFTEDEFHDFLADKFGS